MDEAALGTILQILSAKEEPVFDFDKEKEGNKKY